LCKNFLFIPVPLEMMLVVKPKLLEYAIKSPKKGDNVGSPPAKLIFSVPLSFKAPMILKQSSFESV